MSLLRMSHAMAGCDSPLIENAALFLPGFGFPEDDLLMDACDQLLAVGSKPDGGVDAVGEQVAYELATGRIPDLCPGAVVVARGGPAAVRTQVNINRPRVLEVSRRTVWFVQIDDNGARSHPAQNHSARLSGPRQIPMCALAHVERGTEAPHPRHPPL